MGVYAILDEYDADQAGIHVQAVTLVNGHREPPIRTFAYRSNGSGNIPRDIYNFLEKAIEKNYTVYVGNDYNLKYRNILNKLKHRFVTKDILTFAKTLPESKREELCGHVNKMSVEATKVAQDCLEYIVKKTSNTNSKCE